MPRRRCSGSTLTRTNALWRLSRTGRPTVASPMTDATASPWFEPGACASSATATSRTVRSASASRRLRQARPAASRRGRRCPTRRWFRRCGRGWPRAAARRPGRRASSAPAPRARSTWWWSSCPQGRRPVPVRSRDLRRSRGHVPVRPTLRFEHPNFRRDMGADPAVGLGTDAPAPGTAARRVVGSDVVRPEPACAARVRPGLALGCRGVARRPVVPSTRSPPDPCPRRPAAPARARVRRLDRLRRPRQRRRQPHRGLPLRLPAAVGAGRGGRDRRAGAVPVGTAGPGDRSVPAGGARRPDAARRAPGVLGAGRGGRGRHRPGRGGRRRARAALAVRPAAGARRADRRRRVPGAARHPGPVRPAPVRAWWSRPCSR